MDKMWDTLYKEAKKVLKPRKVSEMLETAGVAAAVESVSGKIYVGVCVDGGYNDSLDLRVAKILLRKECYDGYIKGRKDGFRRNSKSTTCSI